MRTLRTHLRRRPVLEPLEQRMLLTSVTATNPVNASHRAPTAASVHATFADPIDPVTATSENFVIHAMQRGSLSDATVAAAGNELSASSGRLFFPGEAVQVSATSALRSSAGEAVIPHVWQFRTAVATGSGRFLDSGQRLSDQNSTGVALGDLDGDGDLDAFVTNGNQPDRVWLNDGNGTLTDSGQAIGSQTSFAVALGDIDNDGDLDAVVVTRNRQQASYVLLNDGDARFANSGQRLRTGFEDLNVSLGDVDGDGDLDAVISSGEGGGTGTDSLWINEGGLFSQSYGSLSNSFNFGVELGDIDRDGDLDLVVAAGFGQPNRVFANEAGELADSGLSLGNHSSFDVALGDVDEDGDLDAFFVNFGNHADRVWLSDTDSYGRVELTDSGQMLGNHDGSGIALGDLDADGDLDAFVANYQGQANRVWLNSGGTFVDSGQTLGNGSSYRVALGDLDGDGDLDAVVANFGANRVWLNENLTPDVSLTIDQVEIAEDGGQALVTATLSSPHQLPVTVELQTFGTATEGSDYQLTSSQIVVPQGELSASVAITALQDMTDEPNESVILDVADVTNGIEVGTQQVATTIVDDDEPTLVVVSLEQRITGFRVDFSSAIEQTELNLYDTEIAAAGSADVTLIGASSGPVAGTLLLEDSSITFVKTGGPLEPDRYTVSLRSSPLGFRNQQRGLLDGDEDGVPGGDYVETFDIVASDARLVSLPDFARGPGQPVDLPVVGSGGIPIALSDGRDVQAVELQLRFDPELLSVTSAVAPGGGAVTFVEEMPGVANINVSSPVALTAGEVEFVRLEASVPLDAPYGRYQSIVVSSVAVRDGNGDLIEAIADDAIQLTMFFGDVSGNRRINASDAALVARVAADIDSGFGAALRADPRILGDISGNGRINALDASLLAQFVAGIDVPGLPRLPSIATAPYGAEFVYAEVRGLSLRARPLKLKSIDRIMTELRCSQPAELALEEVLEQWFGGVGAIRA